MNLLPHRPRHASAHGLPVETGDGECADRRGSNEDFRRLLRSSRGHWRGAERNDRARRQFTDHITRRARENAVRFRRRAYLAAQHHVHGRGSAFHQEPIANQDGLGRVRVDRELLEHDVGEQRRRLDVTA